MPKIFALPIFLAFLLISVNGAAQVKLVEEGEALAVVVIADDPTPTAEYAAGELVGHVRKASGAELRVVRESDVPEGYDFRVFVGETEAASQAGIDVEELEKEETVLRVAGNDLFVLGLEAEGVDPLFHDYAWTGTLFGVYEIIERYIGTVWAWPGELGTYVPARDNIVIEKNLDERFKPELEWRILSWSSVLHKIKGWRDYEPELKRVAFSREGLENYGRDLEVYLRRHRQTARTQTRPRVGHVFHGWWQEYGDEHPEWFMLNEQGERGTPNGNNPTMCVSNPGLHDYILESWDGESDIRLGESDRRWTCRCEACREWDAPLPAPENLPEFFLEDGEIREGSFYNFPGPCVSDRYARFWKTVYERAREKNPDARVNTYLYYAYFPAPVEVTDLGPGIYGEFVQWGDPYLNWFPMREDAFKWLKEQWDGWYDTGITMAYRPNYLHDGWVMPHVETRQAGEFFKHAYERGMVGSRFDSLCGQWAAQGPKLYLHARLNAKPRLEIDGILDEYYSVFGPAEAEVREYFGYWEDYAYANMERFIDIYRDVGNRWQRFQLKAHEAYPPESFGPAEEILGRAHEAASAHPEPEYARRVEFLKAGLEHAKLAGILAAQFDGERSIPRGSIRFERAKRVLDELVNFRREHEHLNICDFVSNARKEHRFWNLDPFIE